jgi:hypothetical protein
VVIAFHADPGFDESADAQRPFRDLLDALEDEAVGFGKPVLLIHGDSHHFIADTPLRARDDAHIATSPLASLGSSRRARIG